MIRITRLVPLALLAACINASTAHADAPAKSCTDTVPKACAKVKLLGEDNDCACFVCNPGTKGRKVVCSKDDAVKKALYKLRDETEDKDMDKDKGADAAPDKKAPEPAR